MSKTLKISLIALTTVAILLLLAYVFNLGANNDAVMPITTQQPAPTNGVPTPSAPQATEPVALPPLPSDNKQAIDSEIQGIDQTLQQADTALSADVIDEELGL